MKKLLFYFWISLLIGTSLPLRAQPQPAFLRPFAYGKPLKGYYPVYQHHYFGSLDSVGHVVLS